MSFSLAQSQSWFERASRVIPGGIYGHTSPALAVPGSFPSFAVEGRGCRYTDVDGNQYIDFLCGYGPVLLGHDHPEVEAAAAEARSRGGCLNHPTPLLVELAEALVARVDFADWAVFAKNGSDLTTWCIRVAREWTRRPLIIKVRGAYHGSHAWCAPGRAGVIPEDRSQVDDVDWNDVDDLERCFHRHRDRVAGLILTPFHHPAFGDSVLPAPDFVAAANGLCRKHGALLVLDDVRCAFRLAEVGSHGVYGFEPDLAVYSKAIANGHPLSAAVGGSATKVAASRVYLAGSYWNDPGPMAAALKTLEIVGGGGVAAALDAAGRRLVDGMVSLGRRHGLDLMASGPPAVPFVRVGGDGGMLRTATLYAKAAARGVLFHPHHNWFMSAAHSEGEVDEALRRFGLALTDFVEG